jgi:hypothetical protein
VEIEVGQGAKAQETTLNSHFYEMGRKHRKKELPIFIFA